MKRFKPGYFAVAMTSKTRILLAIFFVMLLDMTFVGKTFGGAFDNNVIGIKGFAMGSAFTGIADDASAVYYNPAGLMFNENSAWNAEIYGYLLFTEFRYTANSREDLSDETIFVPGAFLSRKYDKWALGFGFYTPYGGGGTAYENFQGSQNDLDYASGLSALTPTMAYQVLPNLSIGGGLSLYIGVLESKIAQEVAPTVYAKVKSEYSGIAGYGGNIGFMYKPMQDLSIGLSVKSMVPVKMDGTVKVAGNENDAEVEFSIPFYFTLGAGYKPNPHLTLGVSLCYMLWEDMDKITFTIADAETEAKTSYKNSWLLGLGMEYMIRSSLVIRTGLKYVQGATEDEGLNPSSDDVDLVVSSIGAGYHITESLEVDVAGAYVIGFEKEYLSQKFDQDHFILLSGAKIIF
jgi:long-chain fatty acid transport protein